MSSVNIISINSNRNINYDIEFCRSPFYKHLNEFLNNRFVFIISDNNVDKLYLDLNNDFLSSSNILGKYIIPAGDENKTLSQAEKIIDELVRVNFNKDAIIIAIGGGMAGDIAGFVSSIYLRGVEYINIPTTLLAMVDSSIGGKTAVNHVSAKNYIGSFYPPKKIIIDTSFINTLDDREYYAGLAEVLKYGIALDRDFFIWLEENKAKVLLRDKKTLEHLIYHSCKLKKKVVIEDELDKNTRMLLNFGHTTGHALEKYFEYKIIHGEAVAYGMLYACNLSYQLGCLEKKDYLRINNLIESYGITNSFLLDLKKLDLDKLEKYILKDKKSVSINNKVDSLEIQFVLLDSIGSSFLRSLKVSSVLSKLV